MELCGLGLQSCPCMGRQGQRGGDPCPSSTAGLQRDSSCWRGYGCPMVRVPKALPGGSGGLGTYPSTQGSSGAILAPPSAPWSPWTPWQLHALPWTAQLGAISHLHRHHYRAALINKPSRFLDLVLGGALQWPHTHARCRVSFGAHSKGCRAGASRSLPTSESYPPAPCFLIAPSSPPRCAGTAGPPWPQG